MSTETKSPTLPKPKPPIDPLLTPFVGNETVKDNLREAVQVAVWAVLGKAGPEPTIEISDGGKVVLNGHLPTERQRRDLAKAVSAVKGVTSVVDRLEIAPDQPPIAEQSPVAGEMLYVRRFCAADETSTSAAIRQAIGRLEAHFAQQDTVPETLVVLYRNLRPETVTLDIGMLVPANAAMASAGTLRVAPAPASTIFETVARPGFDGLIEAIATLKTAARVGPNEPAIFWQEFDLDQVRPWTGHPKTTVHLAS